MGYLTIYGNVASGLPNGTGNGNLWQPDSYSVETMRVGTTLVSANGTRNRVERSVTKRVWTLGWGACNSATKTTLESIAAVATTFTLVDLSGTNYTAQTEDPPAVAWAFNDRSGASFWQMTLKVYEH